MVLPYSFFPFGVYLTYIYFGAALVSSIDPAATVVTLVNLAGAGARSVVAQAGAFGQHDIESVAYEGAEPGWADSDTEYISRDMRAFSASAEVDGPWLEVVCPRGPGSR